MNTCHYPHRRCRCLCLSSLCFCGFLRSNCHHESSTLVAASAQPAVAVHQPLPVRGVSLQQRVWSSCRHAVGCSYSWLDEQSQAARFSLRHSFRKLTNSRKVFSLGLVLVSVISLPQSVTGRLMLTIRQAWFDPQVTENGGGGHHYDVFRRGDGSSPTISAPSTASSGATPEIGRAHV